MAYISIDLGTTNIKVACYSRELKELVMESINVRYIKSGLHVEFNPDEYFDDVCKSIYKCCQTANLGSNEKHQIILTGQAESLVIINNDGHVIRNGISWLDNRSYKECDELSAVFDGKLCYETTGQSSIIPTWPISKMLWLKRNEMDLSNEHIVYMLLKDYIIFRLTGVIAGEMSVYNFSHYFDIIRRKYWEDILDYCGVRLCQLPELVEPCTVIGKVKPQISTDLGISRDTIVNCGTLDHFSGMIGTGNIDVGKINESTGTVLSVATLLDRVNLNSRRTPCHYGPFKDTYVMLMVCESGGISLEWYRNNFIADEKYKDIDDRVISRRPDEQLLFLPYINGVNAPEYDTNARGVFYGIRANHDKYDFAYAIMEGVAYLLNKNINFLNQEGINAKEMISTGGGAKSHFWSQLKADITGLKVAVPENEEAACYGAAIIGAVADGTFNSYEEAVKSCVYIKKYYYPCKNATYDKKYKLFNDIYDRLYK